MRKSEMNVFEDKVKVKMYDLIFAKVDLFGSFFIVLRFINIQNLL